MKWFPFFILAYLALGIQFGLSGYAAILNARPNFVLLVAIFVAVNAPRNAALAACLLLGLMQDLLMHESPLGLTAFAYGLIAVAVLSTQEIVDRDHFLTHISLAILAGLLYAVVVALHSWLYYSVLHPSPKLTRPSVGPLFTGAFYTGVLAPFVFAALGRSKRVFGFRSKRTHGSRR